jgi:SprB repeat/Secretion system C-terminal sorting domain
MKKHFYLTLLLAVCTVSFEKLHAQSVPYVGPLNYTSTGLTSFTIDGACYGTGLKMYINGQEAQNVSSDFCAFGICRFQYPFGTLRVGDVVTVKDNCGRISPPVTVGDDYVYIEVPDGSSYSGNGITPIDERAPYSFLSSAISVGKCSPVAINSHALHKLQFLLGANDPLTHTSGTMKLNGSVLKSGDMTVDANGNPSNTATINANGSITYEGSSAFSSVTNFSGRTPFSFEYEHNGVLPFNIQEFTLGPLGFRMWDNGRVTVKEYKYDGSVIEQDITKDFTNSKFIVTFDTGSFKLFIDDVEVKSISRSVIYSTSSGSLSSTALLPYTTGVNWTPSASGSQWVGAIIDGVRSVRQQFSVAEDMTINESTVNVGCNGTATGSITVNVSGGKSPFQFSKDGGATYQSSATFSGLSAGNYTITVKDASGCEAQKVVAVSENAPLTLSSTTISNVNCLGGNDGSVTLLASGGAGFYEYKINGGSYGNSSTITGLSAGSNTLWVRDAAGCEKSISVTIGVTSALDVTTSITNLTCYGNSSGTITVTQKGTASGTVHYSIDGTNYQTSPVFSNLAVGNYTVYIKDNLCTISKTDNVISQPTELLPTISVGKVVSCNGLSDGEITSVPSGGTPNYYFSIDGTNYTAAATNHTFTGLASGNYKVWVKDSQGCVKEEIVNVSQPDALVATLGSKTDATCFGFTNGQAVINVLGGNGLYQFSIGSTTYSSNTVTGLGVGTYAITVKDSKLCQTTTSVEILQPTKIILQPSITKTVSCYGGSDGEITLTASGGTGTLTYSKGSGFQNTPVFASLSAGNYTVTAKDANGCIVDSVNNYVSQPTEIVLQVSTQTNVSCFGGTDGKVTLLSTGGVGNYTFSKDGSSFLADPTFLNFTKGNYTFTVKDGNSCTKELPVSITEPTKLVVSLLKTQDVLCFDGKSGKITALANGGTSPYFYSLDGNSFVNGNATTQHLIDTLRVGTYKVWVKDSKDCLEETTTQTLIQPTVIVPTIAAQTNVACHAEYTGSVTIGASGGTPAYQYAINGGGFVASPTFGALGQGTYNFDIRDTNGCIKTIQTTVSQPAQPYRISLIDSTNLSCYQNRSGSIEIANTGGTSPYRTWLAPSDTLRTATAIFTNLSAVNYTIQGIDAMNCPFTMPSITLSQPSDITIQLLEKLDVDCDYYTRGSAKLSASGSHGVFTYLLSGEDFQFNPIAPIGNTTGIFDNLKAGDYTLTATDQRGCPKQHTVSIISKNSAIRFEALTTLPSTCLSTDGSIQLVTISGGRPPYFYGISSQQSFSSLPTFSNLLNGNYIVTVADSLCSYKKNVNLSIPGGITATAQISPISCSTPDANLSIAPINGGNGNYQLSLNGGSFSGESNFLNLSPNVYSITIKDTPLSCQTMLSVEIKEQNRADLTFQNRTNILCYGNATGVIEVVGNNNLSPYQYAINGSGFTSSGIFTGLVAGNYRLYARNSIGCLDSLRATLTQPTLLTNTTNKTDNLCFSDSSGTLSVVAAGGVSPYTFSINGTNYLSSGLFTTLTAGNYTTYIKDTNGCITPKTIELVQPSNVIVTPMYADTVRCFGESNGKVQVLASGGTPSYQYSKDNINYFSTNEFQQLPTGNYTFFVKDANQCVRKNTLTLTQPDSLKLSLIKKTNPLCFEGRDGTILVKSVGGNGGNDYTINTLKIQKEVFFDSLQQGTYSVKVTDRRGCTHSVDALTLVHPTKLQHSFTTVQPLCKGDKNGKVSIKVNGGTPTYRMKVDGTSYPPNDGNDGFIFTNVPARIFDFSTLDSNACVDTFRVKLDEPTRLTSEVKVTENLCHGDSTGVLHLFGKGATAPYQYAVFNGYQPSDTILNATNYYDKLLAKEYLIRLKDANKCIFDTLVTVKQPKLITFSPSLADSVRCFGESNGKIFIKAEGGTPSYTYSLDNVNYQSLDTLKNLKKGFYSLFVRDKNACVVSYNEKFEVKEPNKLNVDLASKNDPLCAGEQNGKILLKAEGGNAQYTYILDNRLKQTASLFDGLSQGDYTFKVLDWKGCEDTVTLVQLRWPSGLTASVVPISPVCFGDANGKIKLNVSGGVSNYRLRLVDGYTPVISDSVNVKEIILPVEPTFEKLRAGNYTVHIRDKNDCALLLPVEIKDAEKLNASINLGGELRKADSVVVCQGQAVTLNAQNDGKEITWYRNNIEQPHYANKNEIEDDTTGIYKVIVKNATGCMVSDSFALKNNNKALRADFLIPTQAFVGDTVVCLDITKPVPDRVLWSYPESVYTLEKNFSRLRGVVTQTGKLLFKMTVSNDECEYFVEHSIAVKEKAIGLEDNINSSEALIKSVVIAPNPSNGKFKLTIELSKKEDVVIKIIRNLSGQSVYELSDKGKDKYEFDITLNQMTGLYLLTVSSGQENVTHRILINR